ncbi:MAG: type IV pilus modification protein PilV [Gammaproteobacteria bacterium]|nr:type IV pilus modification protein PilV [Gammaproteobacteria bacterium]MDH5617212.1 type IV pilus modification protein PilV [Gammaproteobacteria bacterium]
MRGTPHTITRVCGSSRRRQAGVSLIEVLVSTLILAIGLVGVAGMQALALHNNQEAQMRSHASALAYDLADRMRNNVAAANAGLYDPATASTQSTCYTSSGCAMGDMARDDMQRWLANVAATLPMGQGHVCIDSTPDDGASAANPQCDNNGTLFTIKVWWDNDHDGQISVTAPNVERLTISFLP